MSVDSKNGKMEDTCVSMVPFFELKEVEKFKKIWKAWYEDFPHREDCLYYAAAFSEDGTRAICRQAFRSADKVLQHYSDIRGALKSSLSGPAELRRMEVHGPRKELEKLRPTLEPTGAVFYVVECSFRVAKAAMADDTVCSIHPYWFVREPEAFKKLLYDAHQGMKRNAEAERAHHCDVSFEPASGEASCRGAYADAEGLLAHFEGQQRAYVSPPGGQLARLQVQAPPSEVEKLRPRLGPLGAEFFVTEYGFRGKAAAQQTTWARPAKQDPARPSQDETSKPRGAAEEEQAEDETGGVHISKGATATQVNDKEFTELVLEADVIQEVQDTWNGFLKSAESREAAGEAVYSAIFDAAPSIQSMFKTPRAVMAMRFMNGLNQIISNLGNPADLKVIVETLGFQHLDLEVTIPRVVIFREAIVDLLKVEMGERMTKVAHEGWCTFLNYVGGAYIYIRVKYTGRLKILASSWAIANNKTEDLEELALKEEGDTEDTEGTGDTEGGEGRRPIDRATGESRQSGEAADAPLAKDEQQVAKSKTQRRRSSGVSGGMWRFLKRKSAADAQAAASRDGQRSNGAEYFDDASNNMRNTAVPTSYREMFMFNAAVMGYGRSQWMHEVLSSFDAIVTNVSNSYRLQEECDILSLRIAKYKGTVNLGEYKAVMLASLRSLVPKGWNSEHEVAWTWLWENVERLLRAMQGKPLLQEKALEKCWGGLDDTQQAQVRREVYSKFFALAPAGQDYFKQSTTRLHFIADRITAMTLEIYKEPKKMVEDISALGLRHVGYGIPTELFSPFVTACCIVVRGLTDDDVAEEAFRWSLNLISRVLTRVITEGSTIVMKAINQNSGRQLRKAVSCAPRGKRAMWMLNVQVGTQSISPLLWAIETGSLEAAKAIIQDLLTIRADRDRYYYGMDVLFERHPDIIRRLCTDAPALLPVLLDGLIWRSRLASNGVRRVNYYIKHLLVDADGEFAEVVEWFYENKDPGIICHPVVVQTTDTLWSHLAFRGYLFGKSWFLFTLLVFVFSQAVLNRMNVEDTKAGRGSIFGCRCFIYIFSMGHWIYYHTKCFYLDFTSREVTWFGQIPIPMYLLNWQDVASLVLTLLLFLMFCIEPVMICMDSFDGDFDGSGIFTQRCPKADPFRFTYSLFSMCAMLMYYLLALDLSVFNTTVSAFVLLCMRVLSEVALFGLGLSFAVVAFGAAVSSLDHQVTHFEGLPVSALSLLRICLGMFGAESFDDLSNETALFTLVCVYIIFTAIFLLNMLIAQLNCAYLLTYQDMVGYARLNRAKILVEVVPTVSRQAWEKFLDRLRLNDRLEFGEGDMGVTGGIQVLEPSAANIITVDSIRRFGGSTSPMAQWPEEAEGDEDDRLERMEKVLEKAFKRMSRSKHPQAAAGGGENSASQSGGGPSGEEETGSDDSVMSEH
jgi:hemoglobin-like flavoprotein